MNLDRIKKNMKYLKLQYTPDRLPEILSEVKEKESPIELLDRILSLEVEQREERRIVTALKLSGLPKGMRNMSIYMTQFFEIILCI